MTSNHKVVGSSPTRDVLIYIHTYMRSSDGERLGSLQRKLIRILAYSDRGISTKAISRLVDSDIESTRRALGLLRKRKIVYSYEGIIHKKLLFWRLRNNAKFINAILNREE